MSIPEEFLPRAAQLGYFEGEGSWRIMARAYDELEAEVRHFGVLNGFLTMRDGFRIWGFKNEETYLLASAADEEKDDPMNIWAEAFQRIELILDIDFPGQTRYPEKAS